MSNENNNIPIWRRGDSYPDDWPQWLRDADIEWCRVEIMEDGWVLWHDGTWHDGIWGGGFWHSGHWRTGVWCNGHWYGGTWCGGEWRGGYSVPGREPGTSERATLPTSISLASVLARFRGGKH